MTLAQDSLIDAADTAHAGGGDVPAATLDAVVEELAPRLLRFTYGLVGDRGAAEEAAQDALVALVERWRRHGPPEIPAAFAFAVARRRAWREVWRRRLLAPLGAWRPRDEPSVEAVATERLEARQALAELGRLANAEREAILLVAVGELDMAAAAACLRLSVSAFKMRLHRARRKLRERVENGARRKLRGRMENGDGRNG